MAGNEWSALVPGFLRRLAGPRWRAIEPPANVIADLEVAMAIYDKMGADGVTDDNPSYPHSERTYLLIVPLRRGKRGLNTWRTSEERLARPQGGGTGHLGYLPTLLKPA
ncbi:MAG: hypothetical protein ACLTDR_04460 [Adlercreutzia equolifaciens]